MKKNDIIKDVWLYILDKLDDITYNEYWYLRGMLDVLFPKEDNQEDNQEDNLSFVSPVVQFFYDKKITKKGDLL